VLHPTIASNAAKALGHSGLLLDVDVACYVYPLAREMERRKPDFNMNTIEERALVPEMISLDSTLLRVRHVATGAPLQLRQLMTGTYKDAQLEPLERRVKGRNLSFEV
jgi:hypothetical protein